MARTLTSIMDVPEGIDPTIYMPPGEIRILVKKNYDNPNAIMQRINRASKNRQIKRVPVPNTTPQIYWYDRNDVKNFLKKTTTKKNSPAKLNKKADVNLLISEESFRINSLNIEANSMEPAQLYNMQVPSTGYQHAIMPQQLERFVRHDPDSVLVARENLGITAPPLSLDDSGILGALSIVPIAGKYYEFLKVEIPWSGIIDEEEEKPSINTLPAIALPAIGRETVDTYYVAMATVKAEFPHILPALFEEWLGRKAKKRTPIKEVCIITEASLHATPFMRLAIEYYFSPIEGKREDGKTIWVLRPNAIYNPLKTVNAYQKAVREVHNFDRIKERWDKQKSHYSFHPATEEKDLYAQVAINRNLFGASKFPDSKLVEDRLAIQKRNPYSIQVLEDLDLPEDNRVVAFASLFFTSLTNIRDLVGGKIRASEITPDQINQMNPGQVVNAFLQTLGTDPLKLVINPELPAKGDNLDQQKKRIYGNQVVAGLFQMFAELGSKGVIIQSLYTRSDEDDGINLSRGTGFVEIPAPPGVNKKVFRVDCLDPRNSFFHEYQQNLKDSGYYPKPN